MKKRDNHFWSVPENELYNATLMKHGDFKLKAMNNIEVDAIPMHFSVQKHPVFIFSGKAYFDLVYYAFQCIDNGLRSMVFEIRLPL